MNTVQTGFRDFYKGISFDCLIAINTAYSLSLYLALKNSVLDQISKPDPFNYDCPHKYLLDIQAYAIIAKNLSLDPFEDLKINAVDNFYKIESLNQKTNERLSRLGYKPDFVHTVQNNVLYLIGERPNFDLDSSTSYIGPGATSTNHGEFINQLDKLKRQQDCTSAAAPLAQYICKNTCIKLPDSYIDHSTFNTVPKNFKTLRPINVEPGLNMIVQKFLGSKLRIALQKKGYDLNSRPILHGYAAQRGSITDDYATIDLSNASDMISYRVIKELLPTEWFHYLNTSRSHNTIINGSKVKLEKFSSMGNGFTFELESVIFLAILMALKNTRFLRLQDDKLIGDISVFGDDLIVRKDDVNDLLIMLDYFGFQVNKEKSYHHGPFRESCGKDYWLGINVRPIYLKGATDVNNPASFYVLANNIRRISLLLYGVDPKNSRFSRVYSKVLKYIPHNIRVFGPEYLGDIFIASDNYIPVRKHSLTYIWAYKVVMRKRHYTMYPPDVQLSYATLGGSSEGAPIKGQSLRYQRYKQYI